MTLYVALVAILNLALGYALASYLRAGREQIALSAVEIASHRAADEWESR